MTLRKYVNGTLVRDTQYKNALVELLDDPAVQPMAGLIAERFSGNVANLRKVVDQQVHGLRQEVRKHLRRVTEHTAGVWDDVRRDGLCQCRRIVMLPRARCSKG